MSVVIQTLLLSSSGKLQEVATALCVKELRAQGQLLLPIGKVRTSLGYFNAASVKVNSVKRTCLD